MVTGREFLFLDLLHSQYQVNCVCKLQWRLRANKCGYVPSNLECQQHCSCLAAPLLTHCFNKSHVSYSAIKCGFCLRFILCHWCIYMHLWTLTTREYSVICLTVLPFRYSLFWDVTRRSLGASYRCFGTTCKSYLQGSRCP